MMLIRRRRILRGGRDPSGGSGRTQTACGGAARPGRGSGADQSPGAAAGHRFTTPDGAEHHLTDFAGRGMVVNLWATWCVPCVDEMPSLAALSKTLAPDDIAVLPLSSDRGGARVVEAFYQEHGITGLPVLLDPKGTAARAWRARGLPTSLIIDKQGRERARLEGSADWSTPAAAAIVRKLVAA